MNTPPTERAVSGSPRAAVYREQLFEPADRDELAGVLFGNLHGQPVLHQPGTRQ